MRKRGGKGGERGKGEGGVQEQGGVQKQGNLFVVGGGRDDGIDDVGGD